VAKSGGWSGTHSPLFRECSIPSAIPASILHSFLRYCKFEFLNRSASSQKKAPWKGLRGKVGEGGYFRPDPWHLKHSPALMWEYDGMRPEPPQRGQLILGVSTGVAASSASHSLFLAAKSTFDQSIFITPAPHFARCWGDSLSATSQTSKSALLWRMSSATHARVRGCHRSKAQGPVSDTSDCHYRFCLVGVCRSSLAFSCQILSFAPRGGLVG